MRRLGRGGVEFLLTLLALAWLFWLGQGLGGEKWRLNSDGRYGRDIELKLEAQEGAARRTDWLRAFCEGFKVWLPEAEAKQLCAGPGRLWAGLPEQAQAVPPPGDMPMLGPLLAEMQAAREAWAGSFFLPLKAAQDEREEWLQKARAGFVEDDDPRVAEQWEEKTRLYREAYSLNVHQGAAYSRPFVCAFAYLWRRASQPEDAAGAAVAAAGLAAMLDGRGKWLPEAAFPARQGWNAQDIANRCADSVQAQGRTSPLLAARTAASILKKARDSASNAAKAEANLAMLGKLWFCLLVWALAGLLVLHLGRLRRLRHVVSLALCVWGLAYAATRPHLEWVSGWLSGWNPSIFLFVLAALARWRLRLPPSEARVFPASRCAYPGFVLFVGLGWMVLADLSSYADPDNRFLALYQQAYIFFAFLLVSLLPALSLPLARWGLRLWSLPAFLGAGRRRRVLWVWGLGLAATVGLLSLIKLFFSEHRQITSEIFRFFLLSGLAWFLLARGEALASPWLAWLENRPWRRQGQSLGALRIALWGLRVKLALPLLLLLLFIGGGYWLTEDKGPLLVALYAGAIFFSLAIARLCAARLGEAAGLLLGMAVILPYVWGISWALFKFGGRFGAYIAERLDSARSPFLAGNDQIAQILWFQDAALDNGGFGLGVSPWCGELSGICHGVPAQIQSDYIYTALIGVFGSSSLVLLALFVFWLWRLARAHPAVTAGRVEADGLDQAWLSWMCLCWVGLNLAQMAVTVAGNLSWLPLTGITFPFLSFGAWSLLLNALFLGLFLHLHRRN
jgi:cell division protein FtsW (lipid II flippase)